MSKKYTDLAKDIIREVGGKENVNSLRHCITRLRFKLKDESVANDENLKNMKGVVTVVKAGGEYMVVIGEHVADVYDEVCDQLGIAGERDLQVNEDEDKNKSLLDRALGIIMAGMGPALNLLCACGIIKGLNLVFVMLGLSTDSGIYMLLNAAGDSLFYAMPVLLGFNVSKKLGIDPYFGLLFGTALTYPTIQGIDLDLFGFTVNATYTSSFLPVMFGLIVAAPLYRFLNDRLSPLVKGFLTPLLTLAIMFPLTFALIGPFANLVGNGLNYAINFLFNISPIIGCTVLAGLWQILVMFGIHGVPMMFAFMDLMAGNPNTMIGCVSAVCFGVSGILFATMIKSRNQDFKATCGSAGISAVLGVTEPGMYGIIVPRKLLLGISCVAGAVSGFIMGIFGMKAYTYAGMGLIGMLGLINPSNPQILPIILAVIVTFAVGFALTMVLYKDDNASESSKTVKHDDGKKPESILMPVNGEVRALSESSDEAFSTGLLGKGVVIFPESEEVVSPIDGTIRTFFPTKHAIGIVSDDGLEVLLHIGINTVNL